MVPFLQKILKFFSGRMVFRPISGAIVGTRWTLWVREVDTSPDVWVDPEVANWLRKSRGPDAWVLDQSEQYK